MRFDNKVVVITGAGNGMGEAAARRFSPRAPSWCWPTGPKRR